MKVYLGSQVHLRSSAVDFRRPLLNFFNDPNAAFEHYKGEDVVCDSGAFSFMANPKKLKGIDIYEYCDRYCECVNKYHIEHYFEIDVDTLLGVDKARELRKRMEEKAFHVPIPVWHRERGKRGWEEMCDNYDYVALPLSGKNATSQWLRKDNYKRLWWFVDEAHRRGARVHALGVGANQSVYRRGAFFSCDSVTYTFALRSRSYHVFDPLEVRWKIRKYSNDGRYDWTKVRDESLRQWVFFSKWAEVNL